MNLHLTDDQVLLRDTFAKLFQNESSPERVRAAEATGFDEALWAKLVELGVPLMRVPAESADVGFGLLDAAILAEEAGKHLASAPIVEAMIAGRLLAESDNPAAAGWLERLGAGEAIVSLALSNVGDQPHQLVPAGAIAHAVICLEGDTLFLVSTSDQHSVLSNLADSSLARWQLSSESDCERLVLIQGKSARQLHESAVEEWKLLTAAALAGLGRQALELAADYSRERTAFDCLIGSYQGLAHPLADSATEIDGAQLAVWRAIWALGESRSDASASISMAYWWACQATSRAVAKSLHVFGGYGLSLEYDIQLYHRKGKGWPLVFGDPGEELERLAQRLFAEKCEVGLPPAGRLSIDFSYGDSAEKFAEQGRQFFQQNLDDDLRSYAHHSWEGHHPEFQRKLADAGLLLPDWPEEFGGQGRNEYDMAAVAAVFHEFGWTRNAIAVVDMVGKAILTFGSDVAKHEVLPRLTSGEAICCLGFSEPSCGSDVFAAQSRAVRDGDDWLINGQKMFTSGADIADYVLLLTRTNPDAAKHQGLTLFLVPLDTPGIEVQPVFTLADEQTNITYYDNVRVADHYRLGEIDGGVMVMAQSLSKEQDGSQFARDQQRMVDHAVAWAQQTNRGNSLAIEKPAVRERLAKASVHARIADLLCRRCLWGVAEGARNRSYGPMSKLFSTEMYIGDSADLMDLMAPDSLLSGADALHRIELDYRLSTATSIYAGTSEIMRSLVAEHSLKMPRTRN